MLTFLGKDNSLKKIVNVEKITYEEHDSVHYILGYIKKYDPSKNVMQCIIEYLKSIKNDNYIIINALFTNGTGTEVLQGFIYPQGRFGQIIVNYSHNDTFIISIEEYEYTYRKI